VLIHAGADVNLADTAGIGPLYCAAQKGNLECAALLLAAHADPNQRSKKGNAPVHGAVTHGNHEVLRLLLTSGAKTSVDWPRFEPDNWTPLYLAALENQVQCVQVLLESGQADVNKAVYPGRKTALLVAAVNGHKEVGQLLLDAGADTTIANTGGSTPESAAIECGQPGFAAMLRAHVSKFGTGSKLP